MNNWKNYFKQHKGRKPREQVSRAFSYLKNGNYALDLGAGNFIESRFIAKHFKSVVAVENSEDAKVYAKKLPSNILFLDDSFHDISFKKNSFDLINAQYALPFYGKKNFNKFFKNIEDSLKKDGIFVGQFFGNNDDWNVKESKLAFHAKSDVKRLLKNFNIMEIMEEEKKGFSASGDAKFWHVFHVIAQKK